MHTDNKPAGYDIDELIAEVRGGTRDRSTSRTVAPASAPEHEVHRIRGRQAAVVTARREEAAEPATERAAAAGKSQEQNPDRQKNKPARRLFRPEAPPMTAPMTPVTASAAGTKTESGWPQTEENADWPAVEPIVIPPAETAPEEDMKIFVPSARRRPLPQTGAPLVEAEEEKPAPHARPAFDIVREEAGFTRRVEIAAVEAGPATGREAAKADGELEGQLKLDEFTGEDSPAENPEDNPEWREQLRRTREQKIRSFKLVGGFKLSGDEEENDPGEEPEPEEEEEEVSDFESYEDTDAVRAELSYRRNTGRARLLVTAAWEALLIVAAAVMQISGLPPVSGYVYIIGSAFVLAIMMLMNHTVIGDGFKALFEREPTAESGVAAATVVALLHTLLQLGNVEGVVSGMTGLLPCVAGFGLLACSWGRALHLSRMCANFQFVSYPGEKVAGSLVEDSKTAREVGGNAVVAGDPDVVYYRPASFLTHFLERSGEETADGGVMRWYVGLTLAAATLIALLYGIVSRDPGAWWQAVTLWAAAICLSAPVMAVAGVQAPLCRAAKRVLRRGGLLCGWNTVEEFGEVHALAVDAIELFPSESVLLHGIKTFSGTRIDEAILDAAAVSITAGGPLSSVFRRVIEDKVDILQEVDTLVYEQEMGLSGWVGGRRVLVGNRRLLENHGVDVPSRDYEMRYTQSGRQLVYLSTAGELSAMFVISYLADDGIADAVRAMNREGITLLVRTCDPNVTPELICSVLDLDEYYVEVLGTTGRRRFEQLVGEEPEPVEADLASNGRLEGKAEALTCCRRLRTAARLALVAQVIGGLLGLALCAIFAFYMQGYLLPPLTLLLYMLGWGALSLLLPLIRRV